MYNNVCRHFGFKYDKSIEKMFFDEIMKGEQSFETKAIPLSVNIIFNIRSDPPMIIIVAARNNEFKYRRIPMTGDFTRMHRKDQVTRGDTNQHHLYG